MIIRKIRDEELKRTGQLFSIAFEFRNEHADKTAEEIARQCRESPKSRGEKYAFERWAAFEEDNTSMMAFIIGTPYDVEFDGSTVKMSGVGGVSSLAQYRRHGAIRGCFQQYLRDIYDEGFLFSTLFPFSTNYYRQFGYECGSGLTSYRISLASLPKFNVGGQVRLCEGGSLLADVKRVFEEYRHGMNLSAKREDEDYCWVTGNDPAKDGEYLYVYYNQAGNPKGVMSFVKDYCDDPPRKSEPRFCISCRRFFFSDAEGFKGLLNHCRAFEAYYDYVNFFLPEHLKMENYLPERALRDPLRLEKGTNGMVRVVNVRRALELARYRGGGELTIRIRDGILAENDGTFRVVFADGRAVSVCECNTDTPDADLSITDFSRFLLGTHAPEEFRFVEGAGFHAPLSEVEKVFYKKPILITESF